MDGVVASIVLQEGLQISSSATSSAMDGNNRAVGIVIDWVAVWNGGRGLGLLVLSIERLMQVFIQGLVVSLHVDDRLTLSSKE